MEKLMFDRPRLYRLCMAYGLATAKRQESFEFEGHELLTAYAKYLIEFISNELEKKSVD